MLGGADDPRRILTYDWLTGTYRKQAARFNGSRIESACALATDANGQKLVLVAGEFRKLQARPGFDSRCNSKL